MSEAFEERHKELDELVETGSPASPIAAMVGVIVLALSYFAFLGADLYGRLSVDREFPSMPWAEPRVVHSAEWGDLIRMSGLPRYAALFGSKEVRAKTVEVNDAGFRDPDPVRQAADIVLVGASFCAAGTNYESTLSGRLEARLDRPVRNLSWPGAGPVQSLLWAFENDGFGESKIVVWGMVQRSLYASSFTPLLARFDSDGNLVPPGRSSQAKTLVKKLLRHHNSVEQYLKETSAARKIAARFGSSIPPLSIDPGWTSSVKLGRWKAQPTLFFDQAINSVFDDLDARGRGTIVEAMRRTHRALEARGIRLLVVLIPDKYVVARTDCMPSMGRGRGLPNLQATTELARVLEDSDIEALDLFTLVESADLPEDRLLFRTDDTHWSDWGIDVAAKAIADSLR